MSFRKKDLLGLRNASKEEIQTILSTAKPMEDLIYRDIKKLPTLRGKTIVNMFYENSTRTRSSFELAGKYMGADVINFSSSSSSVAKGETLHDTGYTLEAMGADVVIIRHPAAGAPGVLAQKLKSRIVNAGDGQHEHPTQALLDMYTIQKHKQELAGLKVAIIGDITHSRVARSNIWGLNTMGAKVVVAGPKTMLPRDIEKLPCQVTMNIDEAMENADVVIMLRLQLERQNKGLFPSVREYSQNFGLNKKRLQLAKKDCLVMHPGPMNRGIEISGDIADGSSSVIVEQVTSGVAVRMAILYLLLTGGKVNELTY